MTFLPIIDRELRVASRRRSTYLTRTAAALATIVVTGFALTNSGFQSPARLSQSLFYTIAGFAFVYCLMVGIRNTADCLSEEKREGTLGLLFLTDLKGYDVVLGKLIATSVNAFYGLLAIYPVMAVPLLLGGITGSQFWRMTLLLANTLFFSLCCGLFTSAMSRNERKTMLGASMLILFITGGLPLLGFYFAEQIAKPALPSPPLAFMLASPGYAYSRTMMALFLPSAKDTFWASLLTTHLVAWVFLLAACRIIPSAWQDKAATPAGARWSERWQQWSLGSSRYRRAFRRKLLDINPVFWLTARDHFQNTMVWAFLACAAAGWGWGLLEMKNEWLSEPIYIVTAITLHTAMKGWIAVQATRNIVEDRRSGALEILLSTSLSVPDILRGQLLALQRQFLVPLLLVLVTDFCFLLTQIRNGDWVALWLAGMGMLVADAVAIPWVGMWMAVTAKRANRAAGATLARILFLPWALFIGGLILLATPLVMSRLRPPSEKVTIAVWFLIGVANDLVFGIWAYLKLHENFRRLSTQRFDQSYLVAPPRLRKDEAKDAPPILLEG